MFKFICLVCLLLSSFITFNSNKASAAKRDSVEYIILNNSTSNQISFYYFDDFANLISTNLAPQKQVKIATVKPILIRLINSPNKFSYYLKPGEILKAYTDKRKEVGISGVDSVRNNELRLFKEMKIRFNDIKTFSESQKDMNKMFQLKGTPNSFEAFVNDIYWKQMNFIDSFALTYEITMEFRLYAERHIFFERMRGKVEVSMLKKVIKDSLQGYSEYLGCDECLSVKEYMDFCRDYMFGVEQVYADTTYREIARLFPNRTRDFMLTILMDGYHNIKPKLFDTYYEDFMAITKDNSYRAYVADLKQMDVFKSIAHGTDLLLSPTGDTIYLQSLLNRAKTKHIYMDFWASWCAPCIEGIPYTKSFEENSKQVSVIYISLDKNPNIWKQYSKKLGLNDRSSYMLVENFNSPIAKQFKISEIPRYVIVSKSRKTTIPNAPSAKNQKLQYILHNLK